ncbi:aconitate hydratase [Rhizomicrobium palustre]|uniref:Aconitate hydratase n=1 Tax=Rhizomicrobium palustre TaxID=189966 RepID=A0A846MZC4_9PROT|nr:aconitate hydratase [Rhizomicrobium palustre]
MKPSLDSFKSRRTLSVGGKTYVYFSLTQAEKNGLKGISRLPYAMKVLLENLLRHEDGKTVTADDIKAVAAWLKNRSSDREIAFRPARVLMQDLTGVPAVVDLAAMRDAMKALGGDPAKINPLAEVDLVIDHSVMVDNFGQKASFKQNVAIEYERNRERYAFLRWGQEAFNNFRVVPPGTGICHQVNLEYLAQTVWTRKGKDKRGQAVTYAFPDTLVGTDSHTTMVNGLAVLGWGVGGIEAEAAMLGQPISMLIPEVVGFKLTGKLQEGITATDLVLTVTQMLRKQGVVGKFVEFYGPGLDEMALEDRATIANMAPEYGATCGFFPIDAETVGYLKNTGRKPATVALVEKYAKAQGLFRTAKSEDPLFTVTLELDMSTVEPSLAGPARPQDRVPLKDAAPEFASALSTRYKKNPEDARVEVEGQDYTLGHGDVVIAAITSCTNTSNPYVMIGAGLVAKKAVELGLKVKPWVKTSLAPGSQVVTEYLAKAGVDKFLDKIGFNLVGYGCTTCIGNSGPLPEPVSKAISANDLAVASVLSGNRNFEGRVHQQVRANYLASPMLVVAYALAGSMNINLTSDPIGLGKGKKPVFLKDIWPTTKEIADAVRKAVKPVAFKSRYKDVFAGDANWKKVKVTKGQTYSWDPASTYVKHPPYFEGMGMEPAPISDIKGARVLAVFGDSITTDHISPAGSIKPTAPGGIYLQEHGIAVKDFNSYGSRRGNHEVMERGTFANIRIKNEMLGGKEGGNTLYQPSGEEMSIFDAALKYKEEGIPAVVFGGKEYGTGSSRDWAAKGPKLQGVKAVIVESFERIHRSNLVGMGIAPFVFEAGKTRHDYKLTGEEVIDIPGLAEDLSPRKKITATIHYKDGTTAKLPLILMLQTADEVAYFKNGGILPYVLRQLISA